MGGREAFGSFLLLLGEPTAAQTAYYWVAKDGSDANDCATSLPHLPSQSPCLTIQGTINKVPSHQRAVINLGPGIYYEQLNIVGYMRPFIGIWGPYDADGTTCIDPSQVVINANSGHAVWVLGQRGEQNLHPSI